MAINRDRPAGMDDMSMRNQVTPQSPDPKPTTDMRTVASVAAGRVDSGPRSTANLPKGAGF